MHGAYVSKPNSAPEGSQDKRKWPLFEKSGTKNFFETGPAAVKPARPRVNKVFLLLFVHKK
jgi:hypothetical protein